MNGGGSNIENSGDGGSDSWWELQGTAARGRISSGFLVNPLPYLNRLVTAAEESLLHLFANGSQFGPFGPPASQKNLKLLLIKLINTNNIII